MDGRSGVKWLVARPAGVLFCLYKMISFLQNTSPGHTPPCLFAKSWVGALEDTEAMDQYFSGFMVPRS